MATLVTFHAHPDDECIATGGAMAKAAAAGHRVVLVVATRGERGEVAEGFLDDGEQLADRRVKETVESARILGVSRVEFLGYVDSGMVGTETNNDPACFWRAPVDEAAERLTRILREENADVLTCYDEHGVYGHPDHIQVHRVGVRAGEMAGTRKVYESTFDRDRLATLMKVASDLGPENEVSVPDDFGVSGDQVTTRIDVTDYLTQKRDAMVAHASQISEQSFFLAMPAPAFAASFGTEDYILHGADKTTSETDLFEGVVE